MQGEESVVAQRTELERLVEVPGEHQIDPLPPPARDRLARPPGRVLAFDAGRTDQMMVRDDDAEERRGRRREQGIDLGEPPAADPAALQGERLRRVDAGDQELVVTEDRLELAVEVPPPGAERREQPLPDPVERHVVVARHGDDRGDPRQLVHESPRLAELPRLGAQRQIAREDHQIRPPHGGELQHPRRNLRQVLRPEMDVGDVENVAQWKLQPRTLAYGAIAAGIDGKKQKLLVKEKRKGKPSPTTEAWRLAAGGIRAPQGARWEERGPRATAERRIPPAARRAPAGARPIVGCVERSETHRSRSAHLDSRENGNYAPPSASLASASSSAPATSPRSRPHVLRQPPRSSPGRRP